MQIGNFPAIRPVNGTVAVSNFPSNPATPAALESQAASNGSMFMAGLGALGFMIISYLRATISNPSEVGKIMMITEIDVSSTINLASIHLYINPSIGISTTSLPVRPIFNCNVGGASNASSQAVIKAETITQLGNTAMAAGTGVDTDLDFSIGAGQLQQLKFPPIILRPGQTIGLASSLPASVNLSIIPRWYELTGT